MSASHSSASILFVPASAPERYRKALGGEAGALILDLEDSVAPDAKDQARANVVQLLAENNGERAKPVWVRVNAMESGLLLKDLVAVVPGRPFGILLPKCCGRETLAPVAAYLDALEAAAGIEQGSTKIMAIATETARAMFHMNEFEGCTPRLWGIAWGGEDLAADVGAVANRVGGVYSEPYRMARTLCLFAASAAGVQAVDTVCVELKDAALLQAESRAAFNDGFGFKMALHPAQLAPINEAFQASPAQAEWARRVIAAFDAAPGVRALQMDGRMIDEPHLKLARRLRGNS